MSKRTNSTTTKPWTEKQDEALKQVVESSQSKKWPQIVKILKEQYNVKNRSAKECQERWIQEIEPGLKNQRQWTLAEQKIIFKYHYEYGNKWAKIAQHLKQRTDNDVKNYFYCTLRRGFKKMNKFISMKKSKTIKKQIKMSVLSKCIAVAEDKFERKIGVEEQIIDLCEEIKRLLVRCARQSFELEGNQATVQQLIQEMTKFNLSYRKKKKAKAVPKIRIRERGQKKQKDEEILKPDQMETELDIKQSTKRKQKQQKEQKEQNEFYGLSIHEILERGKNSSNQSKGNFDFPFIKSRIGSGSMDFWKAQKSMSDAAHNKLSQTSGLNPITQMKPFTTISKVGVNKKSSMQIPSSSGFKLMSQSIQDMLQKKSKDYNHLQVPNLIIPSFDSNYVVHSLATNSGQFPNMFHMDTRRTNFIYSNINPLTSQLKKIQSGDFQFFYNKQTK